MMTMGMEILWCIMAAIVSRHKLWLTHNVLAIPTSAPAPVAAASRCSEMKRCTLGFLLTYKSLENSFLVTRWPH